MLLARRNWKLGRADRKGALCVGAARFLLAFAVWIGTVHALPDGQTTLMFFQGIGAWLLSAALLWLLYLALEPELRAHWPHSTVTWNRLLAGRWHDAQVGAHVLTGATVGALLWISAEGIQVWFEKPNVLGPEGGIGITLGTRAWFAVHAATPYSACVCWCERTYGLPFSHLRWASYSISILWATASQTGRYCCRFCLFAIPIFVLLQLGLVAAFAAVFFVNTCGKIIAGPD
jgi:hypothetical protein